MRKKDLWAIGLIVASTLWMTPADVTASAAANDNTEVTVHIADFPITVNGTEIDNRHIDYPFLFYKDITYAPLTWDLNKELGLQATWTQAEGLSVYGGFANLGGLQADWHKEPFKQTLTASNPVDRAYSAKVASYPIKLWDESIENNKETYPFLEFRDVTYLPVTWQHAHGRLQMDLRWSAETGLAIYGGQEQIIGPIMYDDEDSLYAYSLVTRSRTQSLLRIPKSLQILPTWLEPEEAMSVREKAEQGMQHEGAGVKVAIDRDGDKLAYQGMALTTLRETDLQQVGGKDLKIEGTLFDIDEKRKLVAVYTYYPIAVIGQPPGSRWQLFSIVDGKVKDLTADYAYMPQRVLNNADGSAWLIRDRMPNRSWFIPGSGLLALMDQEGNVRIANKEWDEADVATIGLTSPTRTPAAADGKLTVMLYQQPPENGSPFKQPKGLYTVDTSLNLLRVSDVPESRYPVYVDRQGEMFTVSSIGNTITNQTQNRSQLWLDTELMNQR
jgi:hypothetical protein